MGDYETLLYEEDEGVAIVTLNRPEVHNAFNYQMQTELKDLWLSLRTNNDVGAVVLTGAGERAFCSGIDRNESIEEYLADPTGQRRTGGRVSTPFMWNDPGSNINPKSNDLWKPIIAAVNGIACGGALYMLGEADIIIAAENATFFDPHVSYGMVSGFESAHLLQKLPLGETLRLVLMGVHERVSAERAYQVGLVSEVTPPDELRERALGVAKTIASAPAMAIQGTVRAVWMAHENSRRQWLDSMSTYVALGTEYDNIQGGQETFRGARGQYRVR